MPPVSQQQRRFMYATAEGKTNVAPSVGKEFVNAGHGVTGLPNRAPAPKPHPASALRQKLRALTSR